MTRFDDDDSDGSFFEGSGRTDDEAVNRWKPAHLVRRLQKAKLQLEASSNISNAMGTKGSSGGGSIAKPLLFGKSVMQVVSSGMELPLNVYRSLVEKHITFAAAKVIEDLEQRTFVKQGLEMSVAVEESIEAWCGLVFESSEQPSFTTEGVGFLGTHKNTTSHLVTQTQRISIVNLHCSIFGIEVQDLPDGAHALERSELPDKTISDLVCLAKFTKSWVDRLLQEKDLFPAVFDKADADKDKHYLSLDMIDATLKLMACTFEAKPVILELEQALQLLSNCSATSWGKASGKHLGHFLWQSAEAFLEKEHASAKAVAVITPLLQNLPVVKQKLTAPSTFASEETFAAQSSHFLRFFTRWKNAAKMFPANFQENNKDAGTLRSFIDRLKKPCARR